MQMKDSTDNRNMMIPKLSLVNMKRKMFFQYDFSDFNV